MRSNRLSRLARRLTGTEATVSNLAEHLRGERELIQLQASSHYGEVMHQLAQMQELATSRHRETLRHLEGLIDGLQENGRLLREICEAMNRSGAVASVVEHPSADVPQETADRLDRFGVFCIGSARSGTTILTLCLNQSPRIHVVSECNSYRHRPGNDFRRFYNQRMAETGNPKLKGTWLPDLDVRPSEPRRYFGALSRSFEFVGEKLCFGPEPGLKDCIGRALDWQSRYYLNSHYFCTIRKPHACVWSMAKMFPQEALRHICRTWLLTAGLILDVYRNFPNAYVILNENFSVDTIARIGQVLGVPFDLPSDLIADKHVHTKLEGDALPPLLAGIEPELSELNGVYQDLRACFDPETLRESRSQSVGSMLDSICRRIRDLESLFDKRDSGQVNSTERSGRSAVRVADESRL